MTRNEAFWRLVRWPASSSGRRGGFSATTWRENTAARGGRHGPAAENWTSWPGAENTSPLTSPALRRTSTAGSPRNSKPCNRAGLAAERPRPARIGQIDRRRDGLPLGAALEGWEPYIWIVSDTRRQACATWTTSRANCWKTGSWPRTTPRGPRGPVWRAGSIVLRNGAAIEAFGTGQRIRGRRRGAHRPTLIVCDDLQNDGHILSAVQRDHSRSWFHGTLMKAGTARTNVVNLATALHRDALAMELHRRPGWKSRLFKAIQRWPENMSLWEQWETLFTDVENPRYRPKGSSHRSLSAGLWVRVAAANLVLSCGAAGTATAEPAGSS